MKMMVKLEIQNESQVLNRLAYGILPTLAEQRALGLPVSKVCELWRRGMADEHEAMHKAVVDEFRATGKGTAWFLDAEPGNKQDAAILEQTEEALALVEDLYDTILDSAKKRQDGTLGISDEDCILKVSRYGNSEGILVKQCPYGHDIKIVVIGHTGPRNYDPSDGTVEFEPGCKAFRFALAYRYGMPGKDQLIQDVAAYLKISKERRGRGYVDEGGTTPDTHNVPFHNSMRTKRRSHEKTSFEGYLGKKA